LVEFKLSYAFHNLFYFKSFNSALNNSLSDNLLFVMTCNLFVNSVKGLNRAAKFHYQVRQLISGNVLSVL